MESAITDKKEEAIQGIKDALFRAAEKLLHKKGTNQFGTPDDLDTKEILEYICTDEPVIEAHDKLNEVLMGELEKTGWLHSAASLHFNAFLHRDEQKAERKIEQIEERKLMRELS